MAESLPLEFSKPLESRWCRSVAELVKVDFKWTIEYFNIYLICGASPESVSSEFSVEEYPLVKWRLKLGSLTNQAKSIPIKLFYSSEEIIKHPIPVRVKCCILNKNGERVCQLSHHFVANLTPKWHKYDHSTSMSVEFPNAIYPDFIASDTTYKNSISKEGHITFIVGIEMLIDKKTVLSGKTMVVRKNEWNNRVAELFQTMKQSDVTINIGMAKFEAHKFILAASSPVFAAMFAQKMKEATSNQVSVTDVDPDVFQEALRFIYTGRVSTMYELAPRLLAAADKYMLENLKEECEAYLSSELNIENCVEFLMLAERYSAPNLEKYAISFFRRNTAQVLALDTWKMTKNKKLLALLKQIKHIEFNNSLEQMSSSITEQKQIEF